MRGIVVAGGPGPFSKVDHRRTDGCEDPFFSRPSPSHFCLRPFKCGLSRSPPDESKLLRGNVTFERAGKLEVLKAGDPVFVKDRIMTGPESAAEIVFADNSRMKIAANTALEITGYLYNPAEKIRQGLISLTRAKPGLPSRTFRNSMTGGFAFKPGRLS